LGQQIVGDTIPTSLGQSAFSPDGNWFGRYQYYGIVGQQTNKRVDLYQFDRCTGELSSHLHEVLPGEGAPGGVAFSPNSKLMYISA